MPKAAFVIRSIGIALWLILTTAVSSVTAQINRQPEVAVFVDPRVDGYDDILSDLPDGDEVIVLDTESSGMQQIADALHHLPSVTAIHIISHGESGKAVIGASGFSFIDIPHYRNELRAIGRSLGPNGEILFFGCNIGSGELGSMFVHQLAGSTGVTVAASTNLTGSSILGGDWVLEQSTGAIRTATLFTRGAEEHFRGLLLACTVSNGSRGGLTLIPATVLPGFTADSSYYIEDSSVVGGHLEFFNSTVVSTGSGSPFAGSNIDNEHFYFNNTDACVTSGYFELVRISDRARWEVTVNFSTPVPTVTVTGNPSDTTVCSGTTASFTAAVSASTTPLIQWQLSTNSGSTWSNIQGATNTTYSFSASVAQSGNQYRAVFTGACSTRATTAATLTVNTPPTVTTNPTNQSVCAGNTASFSASASGTPTPDVQWQISTNSGSTWNNLSGETGTTLSFTASSSQTGNTFRAVFTNTCGSDATTAATLTVNTAPSVTANPTNQTVCSGTTASFSAAASGTPTPGVQWQVSTNSGGSWSDVSGATGTTLSFTASTSQSGNQYRAVFTNTCSSVATTGASLTVNTSPSITTNPTDQSVCSGNTASFSAAASGTPTPGVQWQVSTNSGGSWSDVSGATGTTLSFTASTAQSGNQYRAVFTNSCDNATSSAATLTVNTAPAVTTNPTNQTVCSGNTASFTASAGGTPTPSVQWQVSTNSGGSWSDVSGATGTTLSFTASTGQNGNQYRAVFTNTCNSMATTAASLTVNTSPSITTNPTNQTVCSGNTASFSAAASGTPTPGVQWQVSTNSGGSWSDVSGATGTTLSFTASTAQSGNQYRAVFTNTCNSAISLAATLTVNTASTVTVNPTNQTVCVGNTASFSAAASGTPTPSVQWQVSTNSGGSWSDVSGATGTTLSFTALTAQSGTQYRAAFTNSCDNATSSAATLTVNTAPAVTTNPTNQTVCSGNTASFTAAASGTPVPSVQWQVSTNSGGSWSDVSGATGTTLSFSATMGQSGNQYRAVFTNTCSSATTTAAALSVNGTTGITSNPSNQSVCNGQSVSFSAAATGTPSVQWQVSTNSGGSWSDINSATSTTLSFTAASAQNGNQYRAVFMTDCGNETTSAATLTVNTAPSITGNPSTQTLCAGTTATFTAAATGTPTPSVQWQISTNGGSDWSNLSGETSTTLSFTTNSSQSGYQYHAVFTNSCSTATTSAATLTISGSTSITTNPSDQTVCAGANVSFSAAASGSPAVQWQVSTNSGSSWSDVTNATSTTLSFTAQSSQSGNQYRAVFTSTCGTIPSSAATLTLSSGLSIQTNPANRTVCTGTTASFTAAVNGTASVQWQVSTNSGGSWSDISNATSTTLSFTASLTQSGNQYRAHFSSSCGDENTAAALLTVSTAPVVTSNPSNQTVCSGGTASFSAAASGTPAPPVRWQVSTNSGSSWSDINGATSTTLSFAAPYSANGNRYRAVFSSSCDSALSTAATLTVHAPPTISVSVSPTMIWASNKKTKPISASISTTGSCTPLSVVLVSITSSDANDSNYVNNATFGTDDRSFDLRADRNSDGSGRVYTITYRVTDNAGNTTTATATVEVPGINGKVAVSGTETESALVTLGQITPNPFTAETEIGFTLTADADVSMKIFDANGREVATLIESMLSAGPHKVQWDGHRPDGKPVPNGIYLCQIRSADIVVTRRLVVLR